MSETPTPTAANVSLVLTSQQHDTVLAAMRYWQRAAEAGRVDPDQDSIATDSGDALPVDAYDSFIEDLNGGTAPQPTFIATVSRMLTTSESLDLRLSKVANDDLQVLVIPRLAEAKDEDEPGVAAFRALLARPVKVVVAKGENPDEVLAALLTEHSALREEVSSDLDAHRAQLDEARKAAQTAREEAAKAKAPASKTATKTAKPGKPAKGGKATKVTAKASEAKDATDATETAPTAQTAEPETSEPAPAPPPPAAPCGTPSLFSDMGF